MFSSTQTKLFTCSAAWRRTLEGKGQRVMGRMRPALIPSLRAWTTAFFATREAMPKAATQTSASSIMYSSYMTSFSSTVLYRS